MNSLPRTSEFLPSVSNLTHLDAPLSLSGVKVLGDALKPAESLVDLNTGAEMPSDLETQIQNAHYSALNSLKHSIRSRTQEISPTHMRESREPQQGAKIRYEPERNTKNKRDSKSWGSYFLEFLNTVFSRVCGKTR